MPPAPLAGICFFFLVFRVHKLRPKSQKMAFLGDFCYTFLILLKWFEIVNCILSANLIYIKVNNIFEISIFVLLKFESQTLLYKISGID